MKSAGLSIKCHIWTGRYYFLSNYLLYVRPTPKNTQRKSLCSYGTVFSFNVLCWIFIKKRCRKKNIKKTPANIAQRRGENGLRIRKSVLAAFGFLDRILASFGLRIKTQLGNVSFNPPQLKSGLDPFRFQDWRFWSYLVWSIMMNIMRPDEGRVVDSTTISGVGDVNVAHADINISVQSVTNNTVPS